MYQSATPEQITALLDFLLEHKDLARGKLRSTDGRLKAKRLWEGVTEILNSMEGASKTVQQWQKVWADKKHMSKKNVALAKESTGPGGGPSSFTLSDLDLRVLDIVEDGFGEPLARIKVKAVSSLSSKSASLSLPQNPLSPPTPASSSASEEEPTTSPRSQLVPPNAALNTKQTNQPSWPTPTRATLRDVRSHSRPTQQRRLLRRPAVSVATVQERLLRIEEEKLKLKKEKLKILRVIKNELALIRGCLHRKSAES